MDLVIPQTKIHIPMEVVIPQIMLLGSKESPKEACGVVIPKLSDPPDQWVHQLINRANDPCAGYAIDPETIAAIRRDPDVWCDVLVWHTHPSGHVGPSRGDMTHRLDGVKYLVVSLPNGEAVLF